MGVDLFFFVTSNGSTYHGVPTNPYAATFQLSGLAEVIVDSGRKATPQATVGDD